MIEDLTGINDAAAHFGITIRTIRFYEDRGLVMTRRKSIRGARFLDRDAMARLSQILDLKESGLTIFEISDLIRRAKGKEPALTRDEIEAQLKYVLDDRAKLDRRIAILEASLKACL